MAKDTEKLQQVGFFDGLSDAEVKKVAQAGTVTTVPANWAVISEQTPADKAYIVLDGELSVRQKGQEIARMGPGDVIGEIGIVEHRLRTASVVSLTRLEVIHFTREKIVELADSIPAFGDALRAAAEARRGSDGSDD